MSGPVVWADATGRRDVRIFMRKHREASQGNVTTQWCKALYPSMGVQVLLLVRSTRPVRTEFALAFELDHLEVLANIAMAGTLSMVVEEPMVGDGVTEIEADKAVSIVIDRPGLLEILHRMPALQAVDGVLRTLHGMRTAYPGDELI